MIMLVLCCCMWPDYSTIYQADVKGFFKGYTDIYHLITGTNVCRQDKLDHMLTEHVYNAKFKV
jgi:hypothetical protein